MKITLSSADPYEPSITIDPANLHDLVRIGNYYPDDGVIYVDGEPYEMPQPDPARPTGPTLTYVRELEAVTSRLSAMVQSAVKNNYGSVAGEDGKLYMMIAADDFETMDSFVDSLESAKEATS